MGQLTTHVLDVASGIPAAGVTGRLCGEDGGALADFTTDNDGRCPAPLLQGHAFHPGLYRLTFWTAAYFRARGVALPEPPFFDDIHIHFGVADASVHYHIPLLLSPWSFSTYRGS